MDFGITPENEDIVEKARIYAKEILHKRAENMTERVFFRERISKTYLKLVSQVLHYRKSMVEEISILILQHMQSFSMNYLKHVQIQLCYFICTVL